MIEFLKAALSALPTAATNPLALVGYLITVIAWVLVELKVKRNKQLLESIEKLPKKDRLKALELEMGPIRLKSNLEPGQWLKDRNHQYYVLALTILCLTAITIFAIASFEAIGQIGMAITGYGSNHSPSEFTLHYDYFEEDGILYVEPHMAYLDLLFQGGPVYGTCEHFNWTFPEISIKAVNNQKETVLLTEVIVFVESSEVNLEPIVLIEDRTYFGFLVIENYGWGEVKNATIILSIKPSDLYELLDPRKENLDQTLNIGNFFIHKRIDITPYVPIDIEFEKGISREVSVIGKILYQTEKDENRSLWFKTRVILDHGPMAVCTANYAYDLFLESGKSGYKEYLPISQYLHPGEVDHFLIRVASDKSSKFNLSLSFRDESGNEIHKGKLHLNIFVPK